MRYVVLSFDDGRKDFYTNVLPILKKYRLPATLNVITDTLDESADGSFPSYITRSEMLECAKSGVEIACHSSDHTNGPAQIRKGLAYLAEALGTEKKLGFASPHSDICAGNFEQYGSLLKNGQVLYIRSGRQVRRDGYFYAGLYVLFWATKSKMLFRWYNRRNLVSLERKEPPAFYSSVGCCADNSMDQLLSFLEAMPDRRGAVVMLHSVLSPGEPGWGADKWQNSVEELERLCRFLSACPNLETVTHSRLHGLFS